MRFILLLAVFMGLGLPAAIAAEPSESAPPQEVKAIETYLNGVTTFRAHFIQTAENGRVLEGTFMLSRPGRMRFEYDPPVKDFIVADGMFVYYYDGEMKQQSNAPIGRTLADFFLRKDLRLAGDITVTAIRREGGLLRAELVQTGHPEMGTLTLKFTENPLSLQGWKIVDEQGLTTRIALQNPELGVTFDNELFHYYDPAHGKGVYEKK